MSEMDQQSRGLAAPQEPSADQPPAPQNLNVAADATEIYEGGRLAVLSVSELVGNEVAVKQVVNILNTTQRENATLRRQVELLKLERASYALQPTLSLLLAIVGVCGVVLVGFSVNYLTAPNSPRGAGPLLVLGALLSLVGTAGNLLVPYVVRRLRKKEDHAS